MERLSVPDLIRKSNDVRKDIINMLVEAGSGHPGGSLSAADIMVALYFNVMDHNPKDPFWKDRDRFVLSKAHVCPVLYAAMAEAGYFPVGELKTLRKMGSRLQGHTHMLKLPGVEVSGGSLGQGLSIAIGMAIGFKIDKKKQRVYCMMGDGETQEGSVWEAAMSAAHFKLDNLVGIVDVNGLQIDGRTNDVMNIEPMRKKWEAFGWNVLELDGHDMESILDAFAGAMEIKGKPTVLLASTVKGKGVSFMENNAEWHGQAPTKEQGRIALDDLERARHEIEASLGGDA